MTEKTRKRKHAEALRTIKSLSRFCSDQRRCESCKLGAFCMYSAPDNLSAEQMEKIATAITEHEEREEAREHGGKSDD